MSRVSAESRRFRGAEQSRRERQGEEGGSAITSSEWEKIMTGASLATVPLLLVFIIFQRQIIKGIALTGIKG